MIEVLKNNFIKSQFFGHSWKLPLNQNDVYKNKAKIGKRKRKRKIHQSSSTDVGNEHVSKSKTAEPITEVIAHLRWLHQEFANLYEDKGKPLSMQWFFIVGLEVQKV